MKKTKFMAAALAGAIGVASLPVQVFAQEKNLNVISVEASAESTTSSALKAKCILNKNLIKTNLVNIQDGEITQGFGLSYEWDENWFFNDNTKFNKALCETTSIMAALASYSSDIDLAVNEEAASTSETALADNSNDISTAKGALAVMESHGFEDGREYNLRSFTDDNHVAQFNIGHKTISSGEETKNLILITIRGTRGQMEWLSNFAMGNSEDLVSQTEWTEHQNHMGFDIAANRIVELTREYMAENHLEDEEPVFWITGHSRGAAIANLVGTKIEDMNYDTYTYTFATPNTTLDKTAPQKYPSIFNIVNEGDIVVEVPARNWGYTKYGQTIETEMNAILKMKWATIIGKLYSDNNSLSFAKTVNELGGLATSSEECYNYPGNVKDITVTNKYYSESKRQEALASIPEACLPYVDIELFETKNLIGTKIYGYTMVQQPMYFITAAGLNLAGTMSPAEFLTFDVADAYKEGKARLIISGIEGLSHPHYMESYILLSYSNQLKGVQRTANVSEAQLFIEE